MIQPNAQVCRRLAGASLECRAPPFPPVSRSGWVPPFLSRILNPLRAPLRLRRSPLPSPITARKRKCGRTFDFVRVCVRACVRVRTCVRAPRRRYVTSSHGNQCSWPPTRSHGAKPTRLASVTFARLLPVLSLLLFFFIFLPLLFSAILLFVSLAARPSVFPPFCPPHHRLLSSLARPFLCIPVFFTS